MMMHQPVKAAIEWAVAAAKEHVDICQHTGETPDPEPGMGLWQSFQAAFPKAGYPGHNYDLLITAYSTAYSEAVKALAKMIPVCPACERLGNKTMVCCAKHEEYI